ncbi:OLC1v1026998C1 [Oldenlandia corymbosa var. corymbosa]|uniref:OLC1v1026998C1 n=1 Tax=Oldenlandia corymbosa var. corymbosa TaxID=529605 RepID=A0AAV1CAD5_OLDCO|nr:OLC1v1026998C1 [Oldenlandia corymbosa var. corymbosa]
MDYPPVLDESVRKALIGKLQRGKESTLRLQTQLHKPSSGRGSGLVAEELEEIASSFSESLAMLNSRDFEMSTRISAGGSRRGSPVDRSSKGSDQSKKRLGVKDRRGCYRRRNSAESWVAVSPTAEDEYAWRKYGQKEILNTDFPRCYFRCTHKTDQLCKATKQVQKISDDPPQYQITYFGRHTCQNTLMRTPQIISEPEPMDQCSYLLSFETKTLSRNNPPPPPPPISPTTVNQDFKEETHSGVTECLESSMWQHDMGGETSGLQKLDQEAVSSFHSSGPSTPLHHQAPLEMESFGTNFDDFGIYMDDLAFSNIGGQFRN